MRLVHSNIIVDGHSWCAICRASGSSRPPCCVADVADEVLELASKINAAFANVMQSANVASDLLAKEGIGGHLWLLIHFLCRCCDCWTFGCCLLYPFPSCLNGFVSVASQYMSLMLAAF